MPIDNKGNEIEMCQYEGCVMAAIHVDWGRPHAIRRGSALACPHNVPNFGPSCPICD